MCRLLSAGYVHVCICTYTHTHIKAVHIHTYTYKAVSRLAQAKAEGERERLKAQAEYEAQQNNFSWCLSRIQQLESALKATGATIPPPSHPLTEHAGNRSARVLEGVEAGALQDFCCAGGHWEGEEGKEGGGGLMGESSVRVGRREEGEGMRCSFVCPRFSFSFFFFLCKKVRG